MYLLILIGVALVITLTMKADALVMYGGGVTAMRGSIAGTTFSRSKAGDIARSRKKPINPRSTLQVLRRARAAFLMKEWSNTLTEQERTDWRAYAAGTVWTNKLGQAIEMNGNSAFIRLNTLYQLNHGTVITAAPVAMGHAGGVVLSFDAESDTTKIQLADPGGSFDKDTDKHTLWLFQGIPAEPGKISVPKGFKYIGPVVASSVVPPGFPLEFTSAYTMRAGQLITIKAMFQDEHYRISGPHWATDLAAPA